MVGSNEIIYVNSYISFHRKYPTTQTRHFDFRRTQPAIISGNSRFNQHERKVSDFTKKNDSTNFFSSYSTVISRKLFLRNRALTEIVISRES